MAILAAFAALLVFFVSGGCGVVRAQDGLRAGQAIPFVAGEPFAPDKVAIRADARRLVDFLDKYADAPAPKALALSDDGLHVYGIWADPGKPPRTPDDTRRMALQHCEFRAGTPCRLAAADDRLAKDEAQVLPALPKAGRFHPDRLPFWSTASIESVERIANYMKATGPKALAMAPLEGARLAWARGATLDEAREKALTECVRPIRRDGIKCVVFVEGDEIVYGSPDGKRQLSSGKQAEPKEVTVLYVGAWDCPPCGFWERMRKPAFLESAEAKLVRYREVKSGSYRSTMREADWPEDVRWIRELGAAKAGTPRFIVAVDGKIVRNVRGVGNWDTDALPLIQRLAATRARKA